MTNATIRTMINKTPPHTIHAGSMFFAIYLFVESLSVVVIVALISAVVVPSG